MKKGLTELVMILDRSGSMSEFMDSDELMTPIREAED